MDTEHSFENTIERDNNGEIADDASPELPERTHKADGDDQIATPDVKEGSLPGVDPELPPETAHVEETDARDVPPSDSPLLEHKPEDTPVNRAQYSLEIPPSTPRPSSPLRIAIDSIHPTKPTEDDHPTSPTKRKEEAVQPPTEICEFLPIPKAEEHETLTQDPEAQGVDDEVEMESSTIEPVQEPDDENEELLEESAHDNTETVHDIEDMEASGSNARVEDTTEVDDPATEVELEHTYGTQLKEFSQESLLDVGDMEAADPPATDEGHKEVSQNEENDEFIVISQEEAPLELAEEYPLPEIEDNNPNAEPPEGEDPESISPPDEKEPVADPMPLESDSTEDKERIMSVGGSEGIVDEADKTDEPIAETHHSSEEEPLKPPLIDIGRVGSLSTPESLQTPAETAAVAPGLQSNEEPEELIAEVENPETTDGILQEEPLREFEKLDPEKSSETVEGPVSDHGEEAQEYENAHILQSGDSMDSVVEANSGQTLGAFDKSELLDHIDETQVEQPALATEGQIPEYHEEDPMEHSGSDPSKSEEVQDPEPDFDHSAQEIHESHRSERMNENEIDESALEVEEPPHEMTLPIPEETIDPQTEDVEDPHRNEIPKSEVTEGQELKIVVDETHAEESVTDVNEKLPEIVGEDVTDHTNDLQKADGMDEPRSEGIQNPEPEVKLTHDEIHPAEASVESEPPENVDDTCIEGSVQETEELHPQREITDKSLETSEPDEFPKIEEPKPEGSHDRDLHVDIIDESRPLEKSDENIIEGPVNEVMDENPSEAIPGAIEDMEDGHKDDIHVSAKPDIPQDDIHEETESEAVAGPEKVTAEFQQTGHIDTMIVPADGTVVEPSEQSGDIGSFTDAAGEEHLEEEREREQIYAPERPKNVEVTAVPQEEPYVDTVDNSLPIEGLEISPDGPAPEQHAAPLEIQHDIVEEADRADVPDLHKPAEIEEESPQAGHDEESLQEEASEHNIVDGRQLIEPTHEAEATHSSNEVMATGSAPTPDQEIPFESVVSEGLAKAHDNEFPNEPEIPTHKGTELDEPVEHHEEMMHEAQPELGHLQSQPELGPLQNDSTNEPIPIHEKGVELEEVDEPVERYEEITPEAQPEFGPLQTEFASEPQIPMHRKGVESEEVSQTAEHYEEITHEEAQPELEPLRNEFMSESQISMHEKGIEMEKDGEPVKHYEEVNLEAQPELEPPQNEFVSEYKAGIHEKGVGFDETGEPLEDPERIDFDEAQPELESPQNVEEDIEEQDGVEEVFKPLKDQEKFHEIPTSEKEDKSISREEITEQPEETSQEIVEHAEEIPSMNSTEHPIEQFEKPVVNTWVDKSQSDDREAEQTLVYESAELGEENNQQLENIEFAESPIAAPEGFHDTEVEAHPQEMKDQTSQLIGRSTENAVPEAVESAESKSQYEASVEDPILETAVTKPGEIRENIVCEDSVSAPKATETEAVPCEIETFEGATDAETMIVDDSVSRTEIPESVQPATEEHGHHEAPEAIKPAEHSLPIEAEPFIDLTESVPEVEKSQGPVPHELLPADDHQKEQYKAEEESAPLETQQAEIPSYLAADIPDGTETKTVESREYISGNRDLEHEPGINEFDQNVEASSYVQTLAEGSFEESLQHVPTTTLIGPDAIESERQTTHVRTVSSSGHEEGDVERSVEQATLSSGETAPEVDLELPVEKTDSDEANILKTGLEPGDEKPIERVAAEKALVQVDEHEVEEQYTSQGFGHIIDGGLEEKYMRQLSQYYAFESVDEKMGESAMSNEQPEELVKTQENAGREAPEPSIEQVNTADKDISEDFIESVPVEDAKNTAGADILPRLEDSIDITEPQVDAPGLAPVQLPVGVEEPSPGSAEESVDQPEITRIEGDVSQEIFNPVIPLHTSDFDTGMENAADEEYTRENVHAGQDIEKDIEGKEAFVHPEKYPVTTPSSSCPLEIPKLIEAILPPTAKDFEVDQDAESVEASPVSVFSKFTQDTDISDVSPETVPKGLSPSEFNDVITLIRMRTPRPGILDGSGPFIESLKHQALISTPPRPTTSYSWLGALFQPINPTILEAQQSGWIVLSNKIQEPPIQKSSARLRKKLKDLPNLQDVSVN